MDQNKQFEEIEPYSKWKREEHQDNVEIRLPEFKKEDLKIQIVSSLGQLTIKGEHPDETKSIFFNKTINVPKDCKADDIVARFSNGILNLTIKKKVSTSSTQQNQQTDDALRAKEPSRETSGDVAVIGIYKSWLEMGGKKGGALVYATLAVAIVSYVAYKLLQSFHVDDCTCISLKARRYSGFF